MRQQLAASKNVGLARALSKMGFCSRSAAFQIVREGKVKLRGRVERNPEKPVRMATDSIEVDGQRVRAAKKIYLMMNKPRGAVTTARDPEQRETVYDCLKNSGFREYSRWIAPVGRLDKASEGLLLLTNDSEWAAKILDPRQHLPRTYHVLVAAKVESALLDRIRAGIDLPMGETLNVKAAGIVRGGERNTWLEIVLEEGKNRQIRRILENLGIEVLRLVRIAIGSLQIGDLAKGQSREVTREEKRALDMAFPR